MWRRPVRAGLVATGVIAVYVWALSAYAGQSACRPAGHGAFACLGGEVLLLIVGVPVVFVLVACGLKGRGAAHAVVGAALCGALGWWSTVRVLAAFEYTGPDVLGLLAIALVTGVLVTLWARFGFGAGAPRARPQGEGADRGFTGSSETRRTP